MFCKTCGKQLNNDEMVCTSCGTPREANPVAPVQQVPAAPDVNQVSQVPQMPATPEIIPVAPVQQVPVTPDVNQVSQVPQMPATPEIVPVAPVQQVPIAPDVNQVSQVPQMPATPEIVPVAPVQQVPIAPAVNQVSQVPQMPATPEIIPVAPVQQVPAAPVVNPVPPVPQMAGTPGVNPVAPIQQMPAETKKKTPIALIIVIVGVVAVLAAGGVFLFLENREAGVQPTPSTIPSPTTPTGVSNTNKFTYKGMEFTYPDGYKVLEQNSDVVKLQNATRYFTLEYNNYYAYEDYLAATDQLKIELQKAAGEGSIVLDPIKENINGREFTIIRIQKDSQEMGFYMTKGSSYSAFIGTIINRTYTYNSEDLNDLASILNSAGDVSSFAAPTEEEQSQNSIKISEITFPTFEEGNE